MMHRYLVTGTDTDVGKTRITAALALTLRSASMPPVIVKLVQTGVRDGEPADAQRAGDLAGCDHLEVARFFKAADPWSAALADGLPPVRVADIKRVVDSIGGPLVAEGAGGIAVPLNGAQTFLDVAQMCGLTAVIVVGLRLGCINHALLTAASLRERGVPVAGAVLCERWEATTEDYREDVVRALQGKLDVLGILPFDADERRSVERGAQIFEGMIG